MAAGATPRPRPDPLVVVEGLTRWFGATRAVDDLSFEARPGEVVGLLGPNGSGKTTTLRMLAGLLAPSRGSVRIAGVDVAADPVEARRHLGYLPEQVALYDDMTVVAYLRFMARMRRVPRGAVGDAVDRAMADTGLGDARKRLIGVLSKGYRQRVALAATIVHRPEFLILDEPTSALDPRQVVEARDLVHRLGRRRTVLLSTHILSEATQLCDRVIILAGGHAVAVGSPRELSDRVNGTTRVQVRVGAPRAEVEALLASLPGVRVVRVATEGGATEATVEAADGAVVPELARRVAAAGWDLLELTRESADLEQAFLSLTS